MNTVRVLVNMWSADGLSGAEADTQAEQIAAQEIVGEARSNPAEQREGQRKALLLTEPRRHAVCTVQTFRNAQTGRAITALLFHTLRAYRGYLLRCVTHYLVRRDAVHVHRLLPADGLEVRPLSPRHPSPATCTRHFPHLLLPVCVFPHRVIVYDRFGLHHEQVKSLLDLPGVDYYPFTREWCRRAV